MRVKVAQGPADPYLMQHGWTQFLVKVNNQAGVTAALKTQSPNAVRLHNSPAEAVDDRWLEVQTFDAQPLTKTLSGLELEYRLVQLYSRGCKAEPICTQAPNLTGFWSGAARRMFEPPASDHQPLLQVSYEAEQHWGSESSMLL